MSSGRGQAVTLGSGTTVPLVISIFLPGLIGGTGTDITNNWFRVPAGGLDLTGATIHVVMRTAAGTTDPVWRIKRSNTGGSSFNTVVDITATHGQKVTDIASPTFSITALAEGDVLRVDLVTTDDGTGADVEITIVLAPQ